MKSYGTIELCGNHWMIRTEPHIRMRLKDMFRGIKKTQTDVVTISNTQDNCRDLEWFLDRYPMRLSEGDMTLLKGRSENYKREQNEIASIFTPDYVPRTVPLAITLRDYQIRAVELLRRTKRLLVGDDLGLGKTAIGIALCAAEPGPSAVVCQTHLPRQWKEQIEKFAPQLRVHIIRKGSFYELPPADVYVYSYSKLSGWTDYFSTGFFKNVVYDEIQELRLPESNKYSAARTLSDAAHCVLGLSATPVYNYGGEIHAVMRIIKADALGDMSEFIREWCTYDYGVKSRVKDPVALGTSLRERNLFLRRVRSEVGRELPPVNRIIQTVSYDETKVEEMKKTLKSLASRVISDMGGYFERGQAAAELNSQVRMMTGIAKSVGVAEYVKIFMENKQPVLLAGWHREVYRVWATLLAEYNPVFYTGEESPAEKYKAKEAFIKGETNLMIMSLRSGVGLDGLQLRSNEVVFGELDWSPGVHDQFIGRLNRDGQASQVNATFLVADEGADPLMVDILGLKASQAHGIVNADASIVNGAADDSDRAKKMARMILGDRV